MPGSWRLNRHSRRAFSGGRGRRGSCWLSVKNLTDRHIELFLEMMSAERGAAPATLGNYQRDLEDFAGFADGRAVSIVSADTGLVRNYLAFMSDRGLTASTAGRRLSALRQFFGFLYAEGLREDDPCIAVEGPRRSRPLPKVLSENEVESLLNKARVDDGPQWSAIAGAGGNPLRHGSPRVGTRQPAPVCCEIRLPCTDGAR